MNTHLRRAISLLAIPVVVHLCSLEIWAADMSALPQPQPKAATEKYIPVDSFELTYASVKQLNLRTMVDMQAEQLDSALLHLLKGRADEFIQMAEEYQINVYFVCAVAATESGWGRDYIATQQNNYFGIREGRNYAIHDSFAHSLKIFCSLIDKSYLSEGGQYFSGYTVLEVAQHYNPGFEESWTKLIEEIMVQIHERVLEWEGQSMNEDIRELIAVEQGVDNLDSLVHPFTKFWWCPCCESEILPNCVTFEENHDLCGNPAVWIEDEEMEAEYCG